MLCSVSAGYETSQIFFLSDITLKCVAARVCVCARMHVHELAWLTRCAHPPPLLAVDSRQGSDQPCVVFSDGART